MADIFYAHIGGMDAFARGLKAAARILEESPIEKMRQERYSSYNSGKGAEFEAGKLSFEDLQAYAKEIGEPDQISGRQELYENIINEYI